MIVVEKQSYDPVYAHHAAEDLACRLELLDISDSEPDFEEYHKLIALAWNIANALKKPENDDRKTIGFRRELAIKILEKNACMIESIISISKDEQKHFKKHGFVGYLVNCLKTK